MKLLIRPRILCPLISLGLVLLAGGAGADIRDGKKSALSREKGAFYLEDVLDKEPKIKVTREASVYSTLSGANRLGSIPAGTVVSIIAIHDKAYRIRGQAKHDAVVGWIGKGFLQALDPKFITQLEAARKRQEQVEALIAKKTPALGMTPEEVERAIGKATERSSRVDANGTREVLSWITYKNVAQQVPQQDQYGRVYYTVVYVKVESGRRTIEFTDGAVSSLEKSERDPGAGGVSIVPPPVIIPGL